LQNIESFDTIQESGEIGVPDMDVEYADDDLKRLEEDAAFNGGFGREIVRAFRRRIQAIRAMPDERTCRALRSWNFEKLKGKRSHQYSIRLNDRWRLIVEIVPGNPKNTMRIIEIADYH